MKVKLTYKQKNKFLIAVVIIMLCGGYSLSVKDTVVLYQENSFMEEKLQMAGYAPSLINVIQLNLKNIAKLSVNDSGKVSTQQKLLNFVSGYCGDNNTVLKEFPKTTLQQNNGLTIETNVFVMKGNFSRLLNLIYLLEQKNRIGQVPSVEFAGKKDFKTQQITLTAKVFLQNIINQNEQNPN